MIYLFYGSDTARSREKLNGLVDEYRKKYGNLNVHTFDAEEDDLGLFKEAVRGGSLFSSKKLVVVKYLFSGSWDRGGFYKILEGVKDDADTTLVIWDREVPAKEAEEITQYCKKFQEFKSPKQQAPEPQISKLGNVFFNSPRQGLRLLLELSHHGHDEFRLFSYLAACARNRSALHLGRFLEEDVKIKTGVVKPRESLLSLILDQSREARL